MVYFNLNKLQGFFFRVNYRDSVGPKTAGYEQYIQGKKSEFRKFYEPTICKLNLKPKMFMSVANTVYLCYRGCPLLVHLTSLCLWSVCVTIISARLVRVHNATICRSDETWLGAIKRARLPRSLMNYVQHRKMNGTPCSYGWSYLVHPFWYQPLDRSTHPSYN